MDRHRITIYAMLTPEQRLQQLEEIQARREAQLAVGMSLDSLEPEEEQTAMDDSKAKAADHTPSAAGFTMVNALAKFEVAQAEDATEQQATLDSIQSEAKVESNHCFLR